MSHPESNPQDLQALQSKSGKRSIKDPNLLVYVLISSTNSSLPKILDEACKPNGNSHGGQLFGIDKISMDNGMSIEEKGLCAKKWAGQPEVSLLHDRDEVLRMGLEDLGKLALAGLAKGGYLLELEFREPIGKTTFINRRMQSLADK